MSLFTTTNTTKPHPAMDGKLYYEMCKGRRGDRRCFSCGWFGHLARNCRNKELGAMREKRGDENKNRWEVLRSRVMTCGAKNAAHPIKGNAQQERKCWGCGEEGHCLWACPKKAVRPVKEKAQQKVVRRAEAERMTKEVRCNKCGRKGENTVWIPESVARGKVCPNCEEGRKINAAHPEKEEAQLERSWWEEEEEARNRGWLRSRSERGWTTDRWMVTIAECVDCGRKGKWEKLNQGQGHPPIEFFRNNRCPSCQENWEAGQWEVSRGNATKVCCVGCGKTDAVPGRLNMEEIRGMECGWYTEKEKQKTAGAARPREVKTHPKEEARAERDVRRTVKMITEVWMKVDRKSVV